MVAAFASLLRSELDRATSLSYDIIYRYVTDRHTLCDCIVRLTSILLVSTSDAVNNEDTMENLNVRIEKDSEGGWLAVLPPHPDMPDEEFGRPAKTKEEAEAEARAYRAIEQSSLYKFDFDEAEGNYVVKLGQEEYRAPLLADAYGQAQAAYAKRINEEPPKAEEPAPAPTPKRTRARPGNSK